MYIKIILSALTFLWSGLVLGISFIEAPLKFQAPNITTELGLGIGQLVFNVLNRIELVLALLISAALFSLKTKRQINVLYAIPITILLIQTFWLLPVLDARIDQILTGETLPATYHHIVFIVLEVVKLLMLWVAGVVFMRYN